MGIFSIYSFLPSPLSPSVPPSLLPFSKRKMYYIYEQELSHFYWRHTSWTFEHLHPHQEGNTPKIGNATALPAVTESTRCVLPKMQRWEFPLSPWLLGNVTDCIFQRFLNPCIPSRVNVTLALCHWEAGSVLLPLEPRWNCDYAGSDTVWLLKLNYRKNTASTWSFRNTHPGNPATMPWSKGKASMRSQPTVGSNG